MYSRLLHSSTYSDRAAWRHSIRAKATAVVHPVHSEKVKVGLGVERHDVQGAGVLCVHHEGAALTVAVVARVVGAVGAHLGVNGAGPRGHRPHAVRAGRWGRGGGRHGGHHLVDPAEHHVHARPHARVGLLGAAVAPRRGAVQHIAPVRLGADERSAAVALAGVGGPARGGALRAEHAVEDLPSVEAVAGLGRAQVGADDRAQL